MKTTDVSATVSLLRTNTEELTETAKVLTIQERNGATCHSPATPPAQTSKHLQKDSLEEGGLTRLVPPPPSVVMAMDGTTAITETMAAREDIAMVIMETTDGTMETLGIMAIMDGTMEIMATTDGTMETMEIMTIMDGTMEIMEILASMGVAGGIQVIHIAMVIAAITDGIMETMGIMDSTMEAMEIMDGTMEITEITDGITEITDAAEEDVVEAAETSMIASTQRVVKTAEIVVE